MYFAGSSRPKSESIAAAAAAPAPPTGPLPGAPPRADGHPRERPPAAEVWVELHEAPVAEIVRGDVVVGDVVGVEGAAERAGRLVAVRRKPLAVRLRRVAGEAGRQRARGP